MGNIAVMGVVVDDNIPTMSPLRFASRTRATCHPSRRACMTR